MYEWPGFWANDKEVDKINDNEYFEYLLDTYQRLIYSVCYKAVGNQFDAEDLAQETYLSIYKNLSTFDRNYEKAWVCRIASNKCLDFLKSASRRSQPAEDSYFLDVEDKGATPEEAYLQEESKQFVYTICQQLKEPYREIATEHFYMERTVKEIAESNGKNVKTVQTQVYRAKGMLKKLMKISGKNNLLLLNSVGEIPCGQTGMPYDNNKEIPQGHTNMPCGNNEERSG